MRSFLRAAVIAAAVFIPCYAVGYSLDQPRMFDQMVLWP